MPSRLHELKSLWAASPEKDVLCHTWRNASARWHHRAASVVRKGNGFTFVHSSEIIRDGSGKKEQNGEEELLVYCVAEIIFL